MAPTYANCFMGKFEKNLLQQWSGCQPDLWKRFIDDIISIWSGTEEELLDFLTFLNSFHSTLKFTAEYRTLTHKVTIKWKDNQNIVKKTPLGNLRPRSVDFLDTTIWINENGKFVSDLFVKDSDRVTYLMPQSCHPSHICKNIPYSLGYRLLRICSSETDFKKRLHELSLNLQTRGYKNKVIKCAFDKLKNISRDQALQKVNKNQSANPVIFSLTFDPRVNSPAESIKKHFKIATRDPEFQSNFPTIPRLAFKSSRNLSELLIWAKLYPQIENYDMRSRRGFLKCSKRDTGCFMCLHSENMKFHTISYSGEKIEIKSKICCDDTFVIYSIQCKKCPRIQYVGQTIQPVYKRFLSHRSDILSKKKDKPVANHFCSRNHCSDDMIFTPFEKLYKKDKTLLDIREKFWIQKKKTVMFGLNKIL